MKLVQILCVPSVVFLSLVVDSASLQAQGCPYTVTVTTVGSPCSSISPTPPTLIGQQVGDCDVQFFYDVPPVTGPVIVTNRWFAAGLNPASVSLPGGGCPLLMSPIMLVELGAFEGLISPVLLLPPNPALTGMVFYVQGIDRRFDTVSGARYFETTNGLQLIIS